MLTANLPATDHLPGGPLRGTNAKNGTCRSVSYPMLDNDVFWENRSFHIGVGALGAELNQQNVVALYNAFTTTPAPNQPQADATTANGNGAIITGGTGACVAPKLPATGTSACAATPGRPTMRPSCHAWPRRTR